MLIKENLKKKIYVESKKEGRTKNEQWIWGKKIMYETFFAHCIIDKFPGVHTNYRVLICSITSLFSVAVVVAFFICWAPFHVQRLVAIYSTHGDEGEHTIYAIVTYTSGILYYLSTTVNPILYHIMSFKFREAFKVSFDHSHTK